MDDVTCLCTTARRAALALTARYDAALARHGLKVTQFSLLHAVKRREAPPSLTELAEATGLDRSTLGRNLRLLEAAGWVALAPGGDLRDRRAALTSAGRERLRAATRDWAALQDRLGEALGADASRLAEAARRVTDRLRGDGPLPGAARGVA